MAFPYLHQDAEDLRIVLENSVWVDGRFVGRENGPEELLQPCTTIFPQVLFDSFQRHKRSALLCIWVQDGIFAVIP